MSSTPVYPKHIKSTLLNELLASYELRTVNGHVPAPGELSKRHQDYMRQLLRHYGDKLPAVHEMRASAYMLLAGMARLEQQLTFDEQMQVLTHELGPAAPHMLALSDNQVILMLAAEERTALRSGS